MKQLCLLIRANERWLFILQDRAHMRLRRRASGSRDARIQRKMKRLVVEIECVGFNFAQSLDPGSCTRVSIGEGCNAMSVIGQSQCKYMWANAKARNKAAA